MEKAKFIWDDINIRRAIILAKHGYTAIEAAAAMGTTRASLSCRASRKKEFRFSPSPRLKKAPDELFAQTVAQARELIEKEAPRSATPPAKPARVVKRRRVTPNPSPAVPQVARVNAIVESPLTREERVSIMADEGPNDHSILFSEMKNHHCKWIVGKDEFKEAIVCGRERKGKEPYCEKHIVESRSKTQPRPISEKTIHAIDQSTILSAPTKKMDSSLLRRN